MKRISIIFLQAVIVLIGIAALAILIRLPLTEGRAANLDLFSIYFDPSSCMDTQHQSLFLLHCTMRSNYLDTSDKIKYSHQTR
jgi:hypothetical protein